MKWRSVHSLTYHAYLGKLTASIQKGVGNFPFKMENAPPEVDDPEFIFTFQFFFPVQQGDPPVSQQDMATLARLAIAVLIINKRFFLGIEQPPSRPPPASKDAINELEKLVCLSDKRRLKHKLCSICQEDFPTQKLLDDYHHRKLNKLEIEERDEIIFDTIIRMPCRHIYHQGCLEKWLENTSTCPTCRYEVTIFDRLVQVAKNSIMAFAIE